MRPSKPFLTLALIGGVLGISTSAVLIRLGDAPPPVMAFYRMFFAALFFLPGALRQGKEYAISREDLGLALGAGAFLALHFLLWMSSLSYTSVASSVVLATTHPVWVFLLSLLFLKEKPSRSMWLGLALSLAGGLLVTSSQGLGESRLLGNSLALGGALTIAFYLILGRRLRQNLPLALYSTFVFGSASFLIALFLLFRGLPFRGYSNQTWLVFLGLALFPTVLGHNTLNWALKFLPATLVSAFILGEPLGASLLAVFVLGEIPSGRELLGSFITLLGIFLVWRGGKGSDPSDQTLKSS